MWYEKSFRRNLVDMHIEDWDASFLSKFSPQEYYQNLVKGKIQSPMIYLQSHVGHCYFPTKSGHMHRALEGREDLIKQLVDLCKSGGMDVVGYYSLIYNTYEEDRHPEWKMHDGGGKSHRDKGGRYGLCCPNNLEYRNFVFRQIEEMLNYFNLDGMFYDMLFWADICRCDACRKRFSEEIGGEIPDKIDWYDERWLAFSRKRFEWMGEFAQIVTDYTKKLNPQLSVEHNFASGVAGDWYSAAGEMINDACDFTGGDLYGDLYNHSFTSKYYMNITKHQPFEYMTCRCANYLAQHTITKTREALELEIMLTCAHHGASFVIDAIDPVGTMDCRVYDLIGDIFSRHIKYEPYFYGEHIADAAVFYSTMSRFSRNGEPYTNKNCSINLVKTLIENHVPVDVLSNGCIEKMPQYKFIFAPYIFNLGDKLTDSFISYVKNGGSLYFSGSGSERMLNEFFGAECLGLTAENYTYIAPEEGYQNLFGSFTKAFPMPCQNKLPLLEIADQTGVAARITLPYTVRSDKKFASIHSDPPGKQTTYPALIIKKYGSGNVIWSAAPVEHDERIHYKRFIMALMNSFLKKEDYTVCADTTRSVEIISFKAEGSYLVSAVDLRCTEELIPLRGFEICIKTDRKIKSVSKLPDKEKVDFRIENGRVVFNTGELVMFSMFEVEIEK